MNKSTSQTSFEFIFEHSPIPLLEMDFTELFEYFDSLKQDGVFDINIYLDANLQEIEKCIFLNKIKKVNAAVLQLYEVQNQDELSKKPETFFSNNSLLSYKEQLNHLFSGKLNIISNIEILTKTGKTKAIRQKINIQRNNGQIIGIISAEDICEQNVQEEQFRNAISSSTDAVTISRVSDGKFVFANKSFKDVSGFTDYEIISKSAFELGMWVDENDRNFYLNELKKHGYITNFNTSFRTRNGEVIDVLMSAKTIIYNAEPHILVTSKDVTKLNDLTRSLKQSEEQFRKAFMNIPNLVHINRLSDATFVDINDYFISCTGYSREELIGKTPNELNFWINKESNLNFYRRLKVSGVIENQEITFRMKDGSLLDALISSNIIDLNGEPHIITVIQDISKLKIAQKEIKLSEEKFQNIFSKSPDALAIMEMENWTYVDVNEEFTTITGLPYEKIIGKSTFELNLWSQQSDIDFFTTKFQNREEIINHKGLFNLSQGRQIHVLVSAKLIEINNEKHYLLIAKNIGDFVKIQKTLFEKDNRYKAIVSNSHEGIAIIDQAFHIDYANHQLEIITGYTSDELIGNDFRKILTKESAILVGERYKARQAGKDVPQNYTFEILRKNGEIRIVELHSSVIITAEGYPQTIAQLLDVTDREIAAKILAKEHRRATQYFEVSGMMMLAIDTDGIVTAINKKGCNILETTESNIIGKNWFAEFIPKNIREQLQNKFIDSIKQNKEIKPYSENIIKTSTGKEKLIGMRNSLLKDENDKVIGIISSGEDISNKEEASRILNLSGMVAILWKNAEDWPIEFVSENAEILFGYNSNELVSKTINYQQLVHPDDILQLRKETKELTKQKRSHYNHQPYRIITKSGEVKWINDRTTLQYDTEGNISYYYGILSDITEDVLKGEKLRQSNEIISQMNDAVIITNFHGEITSWIGGAKRIFGYDSEDTIGENIQLIFESNIDAKNLLSNILSDINFFGVYQNEISSVGKDKHKIPIELTAKILYDSFSNPLSLILISRDISNRKIAQKALQESEKRYRNIFESILDGVIIYNMKKEIVQVNKMATQMYGYSTEEFTQQVTSRYIYPMQNHSFEEVMEHLNNDYEKMFEGESVDITKSGEKFFVNAKGRLISYNNQPHLLITVRDITKIKQAENDLFKAKEQAIESEKLKSAFLANMSHEIRTPMNSILGFSDLMADESISADEKLHFIKIIRKNGNQLMTIINDIIDISKIEAGQIKLNYEHINLYEIFEDIFNMFVLTSKEKGLELIKKSNQLQDEFYVKTDEMRLKQILINLISNALKFTHNGFIEFGWNIIDNDKSIHFYVKDSGIGISKNKQEEIFQRFTQAELKTTKLYGGTGLGLAISLGLVHTFKGNIWLESEEGKGSTFNFSIPLILE